MFEPPLMGVEAVLAVEVVVTEPAAEIVVAGTAVDGVIAPACVDHVGFGVTRDRVVAATRVHVLHSGDGVVALTGDRRSVPDPH